MAIAQPGRNTLSGYNQKISSVTSPCALSNCDKHDKMQLFVKFQIELN